VDAAQQQEELVEQMRAVDAVLAEIGAGMLPTLIVLNKVDRLDALGRRRLANRFPDGVQVSALTREGLDTLRAQIAERFAERYEDVRLLIPHENGAKLAELYELGAPIEERRDEAEGVFVRAKLQRRDAVRFAPFLIAESSHKRESA
jgi:GTP-binding protein HflX